MPLPSYATIETFLTTHSQRLKETLLSRPVQLDTDSYKSTFCNDSGQMWLDFDAGVMGKIISNSDRITHEANKN